MFRVKKLSFCVIFVVVCSVLCSMMVSAFSGVVSQGRDSDFLVIRPGFLQGNIDISYDASLIPSVIIPEDDVVVVPVEVRHFISGVGSRLLVPLMHYGIVSVSLVVEDVPDYCVVDIFPEIVFPSFRLEKTEYPEMGVVFLGCTRYAPAFQTGWFRVKASHGVVPGIFGLVGLIRDSVNNVPISFMPGYFHDLDIVMPSEVVVIPPETVVVDVNMTNWGNARTLVRCEVEEVPEGWDVSINSEVFIGTSVLGEDNNVTVALTIQPSMDFMGSEDLSIVFTSSAAGHPEAGVFETSRMIIVFSS